MQDGSEYDDHIHVDIDNTSTTLHERLRTGAANSHIGDKMVVYVSTAARISEDLLKILCDDEWWEEVDLEPYNGDVRLILKDTFLDRLTDGN